MSNEPNIPAAPPKPPMSARVAEEMNTVIATFSPKRIKSPNDPMPVFSVLPFAISVLQKFRELALRLEALEPAVQQLRDDVAACEAAFRQLHEALKNLEPARPAAGENIAGHSSTDPH